MTRWLIVALLVGLVGAALLGIRAGPIAGGASDEILAYEVTAARGVEVGVPAGLDRLTITTWLVVPPLGVHEPTRAYPYAVDIELFGPDGALLRREREETQSRVSGDPSAPLERGAFAARLADGSGWAADPRSQAVDLTAFGGRRGAVQVRAVGDARILVRLAHAEPRMSLARLWKERTLDAAARARLVGKRSALGFSDLPADARALAIGTWGRRLAARGRAGTDFVSRRLLVGDFRADTEDPYALEPVTIGPDAWAVFNLQDAVGMRVTAPPRAEIFAVEGPDGRPVTQAVGGNGQVDFVFRGAGPRTVRFGADRLVSVRFSVPVGDAGRVLGLGQRLARGPFVELRPDVVRHRYFALSGHEPVVVDVFPGQDRLGVTFRGLAEGRGSEPLAVELSARWLGTGAMPPVTTLSRVLPRSPIDRFGASAISEPESALLRVPAGAARLELTGSPETLVSVWTEEPGTGEPLPKPGYDVPLPEGLRFRYAPRAPRSWATQLPTNATDLERTGRQVRLEVFPRIEAVARREGATSFARRLEARGTPLTRRLLSPMWFSPGAVYKPYYFTPVGSEPIALAITAPGAGAGRLGVSYRAESARLGEDLVIRVDGEVVVRRPLATRRGELEVSIPPGEHTLAVGGLGAEGLALVDAPPARGGEVVRSQRMVELPPGRAVPFAFTWEGGDLGSIRLILATAEGPAPFRVDYAIDGADPSRVSSALLHRITELTGTLTDRTGPAGRGLLWEAAVVSGAPRWSTAVGVARIALGDDLPAGEHELVLRAQAVPDGAPLWVRGVVLGRADTPAEDVEP